MEAEGVKVKDSRYVAPGIPRQVSFERTLLEEFAEQTPIAKNAEVKAIGPRNSAISRSASTIRGDLPLSCHPVAVRASADFARDCAAVMRLAA